MKSVNVHVRKAAEEIEASLEEGSSLSSAISHCENISFPKIYRAFVEIAQKTGKLTETMKFLLSVETDKNVNKNAFLPLCIYPAFVTVVSFSLSILLYKYGEIFSLTYSAERSVFIKSTVFLSASIFICFYIIKNLFNETNMLNIINALSFLVSSGIDIKTSLEISMILAGEKHSLEKKIINAIDRIENGKNIAEAVSFLSRKDKYIFEVENTCGNLSRSLRNLMYMEKERRNEMLNRVKNLCEPVMILIVSIYILIIAKGLIIPALFDYSQILGGTL